MSYLGYQCRRNGQWTDLADKGHRFLQFDSLDAGDRSRRDRRRTAHSGAAANQGCNACLKQTGNGFHRQLQ